MDRVMMPFNHQGNERKARELNPYDLAVSGLADRPGEPI